MYIVYELTSWMKERELMQDEGNRNLVLNQIRGQGARNTELCGVMNFRNLNYFFSYTSSWLYDILYSYNYLNSKS